MKTRLSFRFDRIVTGIAAVVLMPGLLPAYDPPKSKLILIQGPRPEVRRFLPVTPRPEPQTYPSGLLSPNTKPAPKAAADLTSAKLFSAYGEGSSRITSKHPSSHKAPRNAANPQPDPEENTAPKKTNPPPAPLPMNLDIPAVDAPVGKVIRPGLVKSPFPPHVPLDVQGLPGGVLVKDPVTGKLFRVP